MKLSKKTKRILIIAAILLVAYLIYVKFFAGDDGGSGISSGGLILETGDAADLTTEKPEESATETSTETDTEVETETSTETETETETETTTKATTEAITETTTTKAASEAGITVEKNGEYTDKEHVALYIHTYGTLPKNFISKKEAEKLGWDGAGDTLWKVAKGKSIGGSSFGNYEGILPKKDGRKYYECDIDYNGKKRGVKRIVYSNDGLIYYTEDHYESFELLYD